MAVKVFYLPLLRDMSWDFLDTVNKRTMEPEYDKPTNDLCAQQRLSFPEECPPEESLAS